MVIFEIVTESFISARFFYYLSNVHVYGTTYVYKELSLLLRFCFL